MNTRKRVFISFKFDDSRLFADAMAKSLTSRNFDVDICTDPQMNNRSIFEFEQKIKDDDFVIFIMTNPWGLSFDCEYEAALWYSETPNKLNCQCYVAPDFNWNFFNNTFNVQESIFDKKSERVKDAQSLHLFYLEQSPYDPTLINAARTYLNRISKYYPEFLSQVKGVGMRPYVNIDFNVLSTKDHPEPSFDNGSELHTYVENLVKELEAKINNTPALRPNSFVNEEIFLESSPVWLPDAENAKQTAEVRYQKYYHNAQVENFLSDPNLLCISAVKGIGKTFLLQIKRSTIANSNDSFIILPKSKPSAENDWGTARITIAQNYKIRALIGKDFDSTKRNFDFLWSITIKSYIVCQNRYIYDQRISEFIDLWNYDSYTENSDLDKLNFIINIHSDKAVEYEVNLSALQESIIGKISDYAEEKRSSILEMWDAKLDESLNLEYFKTYKKKFALFIDKVDAAFDYLPDVIKKGTNDTAPSFLISDIYQFSLYTCAKKIKDATRKIYVYHAIREETLIRMLPTLNDSSGKLLNSLFQLQYSSKDLKEIFTTTVNLQSDKYFIHPNNGQMDPIERFLGVPSLQHPCCVWTNDAGETIPVQEALFECINRHSFGATRDLQYFGMRLSATTCSQREAFAHMPLSLRVAKIKKTIEDAASDLLFDDLYLAYIPRKKAIMPEIYVGEDMDFSPLKALLKLFTHNFLTKNEIMRIRDTFISHYCNSVNPISTLYRLGLLGILTGDGSRADYYIQQFENPYKIGYFNDTPLEKVETAKYFLLHPAVTKYLIRETSSPFYRFNGFVIGRDYEVKGTIIAEIDTYFAHNPSIQLNKYFSSFSPSTPLPCTRT